MDFPLIKEGLEQHPSLYVTEYQNVPTLPNSSPYYCSKVELHLVTGMAADGENYTMQREAGPGCLGKPTHIARTLAVFCKDA
ncbi:hypothetical protein MCOR27_000567 [Pyricularia oryzae]|uniref:Uncharacterized protein n=2 Tax=Pyricularia TaxID=48558 RepID=A0ABQ8NN97_PYRGI|nr:hypothetical protein MCOR01_000653 [Pyricularia oryzae]KAI6299712.1 hypothetical protein MCOR33_004412 [Pyricularia grisea]KAI6288997.1 hypothetical protein MCOR27_000567 [Pyricularia oryzae]KAI6345194.1 hypothetical protein MCOR30_000914 [Pyricularia oryzae]KAI6374131.1 hypothetical protein MCOR32_005574 [Pyricularia oryzae]